jgi:hypothetical protein
MRPPQRDPLAICAEAAADPSCYAAGLEGKNMKYFPKYFNFLFLLSKVQEMLRSGELCG